MEKSEKTILLEGVILIKASFSRLPVIAIEDASKISQNVEINVSNSELSKDKFAVYLDIDFKIYYEGNALVDIQIKQAGSFDKSKAKMSEKEIDSFVNINAPAIIFPFVREEIASLCSKSGVGNVLIQPVNFVELHEKNKVAKSTKTSE